LTPFIHKKRKNWDFKLAVNGKLYMTYRSRVMTITSQSWHRYWPSTWHGSKVKRSKVMVRRSRNVRIQLKIAITQYLVSLSTS